MRSSSSFTESSEISLSDEEEFIDFYTPLLSFYTCKKEPIMRAINKKDLAQIRTLIATSNFDPNYITDYIEFAIAKELLDVTKSLLEELFLLATKETNKIYDLSKMFELCLANVDYDQLDVPTRKEWEKLLKNNLIGPLNSNNKTSEDIKFSISITEECQAICDNIQKENNIIIKDFYDFIETTKSDPKFIAVPEEEKSTTPSHRM